MAVKLPDDLDIYAAEFHFEIDSGGVIDVASEAILHDPELALFGYELLSDLNVEDCGGPAQTIDCYFVAQNMFSSNDGWLTFTLLADAPPLVPGTNVFIADIPVNALFEQGVAWVHLTEAIIVPLEAVGNDDLLPSVGIRNPVAQIEVGEVSGASLEVDVALQGALRPDPDGWTGEGGLNPVPITVEFWNPTTGAFMDVYTCGAMDKVAGEDFGTCHFDNVMVGTFDITATGPATLTNIKKGVEIVPGDNAVDLGLLLGGDVDENGSVNALDVGRMVGAIFRSCGEAGYDANADLDNNCNVNALDIGLFVGNVFKSSPIEVP